MFTVVELSNQLYAVKWSKYDREDMYEYIEEFNDEGTPVVIGEHLDDIASLLNVETEDIKIIERV